MIKLVVKPLSSDGFIICQGVAQEESVVNKFSKDVGSSPSTGKFQNQAR